MKSEFGKTKTGERLSNLSQKLENVRKSDHKFKEFWKEFGLHKKSNTSNSNGTSSTANSTTGRVKQTEAKESTNRGINGSTSVR